MPSSVPLDEPSRAATARRFGYSVADGVESIARGPARVKDPSMERGAWRSWIATWLLPALAVLVPLTCSPALGDFELPKLFVLKAGLALALLAFAAGAVLDSGIPRAPAALAAVLFLGVNVLATAGSVEPRTSLFGAYQIDQGLLTLAVQIAYFFLAASWVRTEAALTRLAVGFALAATWTSGYAIAQNIGLDPLDWSEFLADHAADALAWLARARP